MKKRLLLAVITGSWLVSLVSCYNNKEDILALPAEVSFRKEVVPILTSGACGCHNNGLVRNAVQFSHLDTIWYDAILARTSLLNEWINKGAGHPGGGAIDFAPQQKLIVKRWLELGGKDDGSGCTVAGTVTYTNQIAPIITTTCKGATCHGGIAVALDYNKLSADKEIVSLMMNSGGNTGHPGGSISLSTCTVNTFKAWIEQGFLK